MKRLLLVPCCALLATAAWATTYVVDGPGDGDSANGDEFDSIRDVLTSSANSPEFIDAAPDVIDIVVDALTEAQGFGITSTLAGAYPPFTDDLTINGDADGNATDVVIDLSATNVDVGTDAITIELGAGGQTVTLNDMVLVPTFAGPGDTALGEDAMVIDDDSGPDPFIGTVNLNRVIFTASTVGNAAVDPMTPAPASVTRWGDPDAGTNAALSGFSFPAGSNAAINLTDCQIAHVEGGTSSFDPSVVVFSDNTVWTITNCDFINNTTWNGMSLSGSANATFEVTNCAFDNNGNDGLATFQNSFAGCTFNANAGCTFSNNAFRGITLEGNGAFQQLNFSGTPGNEVVISGNADRGLFSGPGADNSVDATRLVVCGNAATGFELNETDLSAAPTFDQCLFTTNGSLTLAPSNFELRDTNASPETVTFTACTFHDVAAATSADADLEFPTQVAVQSAATANVTLDFSDCIFSGIATASPEVAFDLSNAAGKVVNVTDSAIVFLGPNALGFVDGDAGADGTINLVNVTNGDPDYAGTACPPTAGTDFAVQSEDFSVAGPAGGPLGGFGGFIGGGIPAELSILATD